jgi:hypothetical protein
MIMVISVCLSLRPHIISGLIPGGNSCTRTTRSNRKQTREFVSEGYIDLCVFEV